MKLYIVEDGKLVEYKRTGRCRRCGECCRKKITFQWDIQKETDDAPATKDENEDWSKWNGFSVIWALSTYWYFKVDEVKEPDEDSPICPELVGTTCRSHGNICGQPVMCPFWPVHPKDLEHFPNCGYAFERVEESEVPEVTEEISK